MTAGTLSLDVAVGQEVTRLLVVELLTYLFDELAFVIKLSKEVTGKFMMD